MHIYNNLSRTQILFGNSQENEVGRQVKYCGGSRILLVYFNLHNHLDSLLDKIRRSLKNAGLDVCELSCKNRVADMDTIFDGIKLCHTNRVDFVLCVGDITSFAVAKTICAGAPYTENVYEIFKAQTEIFQTLPLGIVSTTVCGGKAFTNYATVSHTLSDGSLTFYSLSSDLLLPRFAIFSPELCRYDALSVEYSVSRVLYLLFFRYFLKNKVAELSDRITLASIKTVLLMYRRHKLNSADLDSITELMWASINANINPLYDLSKDDGLGEIINGILATFNCEIEEAYSLLIPAWLKFMLHKKTEKIARLGVEAFNISYSFEDINETAELTLKKIKELYRSLGLPVSLSDIGGDASDISKILFKAGFPEVESIGVIEKLSKTDCEVLLSFMI